MGRGAGGTPCNALYRDAMLNTGTVFVLDIYYKRVAI